MFSFRGSVCSESRVRDGGLSFEGSTRKGREHVSQLSRGAFASNTKANSLFSKKKKNSQFFPGSCLPPKNFQGSGLLQKALIP